MSELLEVNINHASFSKLMARLEKYPGAFRWAAQQSISEAVAWGKTRITDVLYKELNLKRRDIAKTISVVRGNFTTLTGRIILNDSATISLRQYMNDRAVASLASRFLNRPKRRSRGPLIIKVRKLHPLPQYPAAAPGVFVAVLKNKARSIIKVMRRTGKRGIMRSGRFTGKLRELIESAGGPSPVRVFRKTHDGAITLLQRELSGLSEFMTARLRSKLAAIEKDPAKFAGRIARAVVFEGAQQ